MKTRGREAKKKRDEKVKDMVQGHEAHYDRHLVNFPHLCSLLPLLDVRSGSTFKITSGHIGTQFTTYLVLFFLFSLLSFSSPILHSSFSSIPFFFFPSSIRSLFLFQSIFLLGLFLNSLVSLHFSFCAVYTS